jgi:hypothetical protein
MNTLLIQGDWLLRRSHFANLDKNDLTRQGRSYHGGFIGTIDKILETVHANHIDKAVIVWEGVLSGINKYNAYPHLRAKKEEIWEHNLFIQKGHFSSFSPKDEQDFYIFEQKKQLQHHFDKLCIRQIDEDESEAFDAIGGYLKDSSSIGENIFILAKDHEFSQTIPLGATLLSYEGTKTSKTNFLDLYGYDSTNDLMLKCFVGLPSSVVTGTKGLTLKKMIKLFSGLKLENYAYENLIAYARRKRVDSKLKVYDLVIGAHDVVRRNAHLINIQQPFINKNLHEQLNFCLYSHLEVDGDLDDITKLYVKNKCLPSHSHLDPFKRIFLKEKEYKLFNEQITL